MRIKSITIEVNVDPNDIHTHAKVIRFEGGMWTADGPMYSRLTPALHEIWKTLKTAVGQS